MLSRIAGYFSPGPPPPPAEPAPEFRKGWSTRRVGNHRFFADIRNATDADFYFITETGNQFSEKKADSTLTLVPLPREVLNLPRHTAIYKFFNYIHTNGYTYVNEISKPYDSVVVVDGAEQENTFILLRVKATNAPICSILDCFRFENRPPIHEFLQTHFEGRITAERFARYGNHFDIVYETAYLTNLYNMAFDNRVTTAPALIENFNALESANEDIVRMRDFPPLVGLQDRLCFYDLLKIYFIATKSFARGGAKLLAEEAPTYLQFLNDRLRATSSYYRYLHTFSDVFPIQDLEPYFLRITVLQTLINEKRVTINNYVKKFILLPTFDPDLETSITQINILNTFMIEQLSLPLPAIASFRPVTLYRDPHVALCISNKYLVDGPNYPKILGFQEGTQIFVGFQESAESEVELQDGTSRPLATLAPFRITLKTTGDIERFYYCFYKRLPNFNEFFGKTDDQLRAEFHTSPLYSFKMGDPLGLFIFCEPRKDVLINTGTRNAPTIQLHEDLYRGSILLDDPSVINRGHLTEWEVGRESGIYYALIFEWNPWRPGGIRDKQFYLAPQIALDETRTHVHSVPFLYENVQDIILKHVQGRILGPLFDTRTPYVPDTVLKVEITGLRGTYTAGKDGLRIVKRIVMPDIPRERQLSSFGFFIPAGTQIDLDLTPSQYFTEEQINAMRRYSRNFNLDELRPFFDLRGEPTTYCLTEIDILPQILVREADAHVLQNQIKPHVRQWSRDHYKINEGMKFLLGFFNEDNTVKTLLVELSFAVPNFDLQVEVYPNRPCFLPEGYFWPTRVFIKADDTGQINIVTETYNQFRNIPDPRAGIPRPLLEAGRAQGRLVDEDRTYTINNCTTLVERNYDTYRFRSEHPEDHEAFPFSAWYRHCRDQFNNQVPHSRIALQMTDFYTFPFTNQSALNTYFKIAGWPVFIPDNRHIYNSMGGGVRRKKTRKNRKARGGRTYRSTRYRNRSRVRG